MHRIPEDPSSVRGSRWPVPDDFMADLEHWRKAVRSSYLTGMGIDWKTIRNVMDMRAVYGGFAAVLREMKVWVMNVVTIDSPDTLPVIYDRGLFGIYPRLVRVLHHLRTPGPTTPSTPTTSSPSSSPGTRNS